MVAGGGIEPPTRGFSVPAPKRPNFLTAQKRFIRGVQYFPEIWVLKPLIPERQLDNIGRSVLQLAAHDANESPAHPCSYLLLGRRDCSTAADFSTVCQSVSGTLYQDVAPDSPSGRASICASACPISPIESHRSSTTRSRATPMRRRIGCSGAPTSPICA